MAALIAVGIVAALVAALAIVLLTRTLLNDRMLWPALGAAAATALITIGLGTAFGIAPLVYLIGISAFAMPVLVLMEAAAIASGADTFGRWVLMLSWGVIIFPLSALVPLWLTASCAGTDCELEDFGGALPLLVSSSAFVLLAWLPAGVIERAEPDPQSHRRAVLALLLFWTAFVIWLATLEGAIDEFTPRIALAAFVGPASASVTWALADRLRDVRRPIARSLVFGLVAGIAATIPGAVAVSFPWSLAVGALAGAVGAVSYSSRATGSAGLAARWGFVILVATAVGYLAPAIAGDTVGILFSAHLDVLSVPLLSFLGVGLFSLLVSAPTWVLVQRHASRDRVPAAIRSDTSDDADGVVNSTRPKDAEER